MKVEEYTKLFGKKLKKLMKDRDVSANSLSAKIGIDRASFTKYFKGESSPRIDSFLAICDELNVEPNYFLNVNHDDYNNDNSKTNERKIIESIFVLCNNKIICNVPEMYQGSGTFGDPRYCLQTHNCTILDVLDESIRYAGSEFVNSENICKKIADKYEKDLINENNKNI